MEKIESKDRVYKLTTAAAPLAYMLPTRNTNRFSLLYFDEGKNINRALRYASNQKSPFEDEQDGHVLLEPIVFEAGMLTVPRNRPTLQAFLHYHPLNGLVFVEVDKEKDALKEVEKLTSEADAMVEARKLTLDQMQTLGRVLFGKDTTNMTSSEIKRDILIHAKRDPKLFLETLNDPTLMFTSRLQEFFDVKLLTLRNGGKELWINTAKGKRKLAFIPFGTDPMYIASSYFKSDEGSADFVMLENALEAME